MTTPFIELNDQVHQQKLQAFHEHLGQMAKIATTVSGFEAELMTAYNGDETKIFGRKIQEWVANYDAVRKQFELIVNQLGVTQKNVSGMSDQNSGLANSLDVSGNSSYTVLSPKS
ncbi:hypothetical protein SAMN02982929_05341 [Saccharopolyspora kobensis]|uniref:Uncharacterized protein n=1 Tax=Saccharopolyspora kobensis TaxID=146035 RepID=A0A1H6E152_9PSEU|nr:hypothetical protein [Saccharopolyspora kobensis]SEG90914.1 hypothetical protein SAMN02982929_05341 [Saccharopolyspora kobensis]SFD94660.1 hypothetical protein SAMN05216506_107317 [Saccharopolyspora kobensis]